MFSTPVRSYSENNLVYPNGGNIHDGVELESLHVVRAVYIIFHFADAVEILTEDGVIRVGRCRFKWVASSQQVHDELVE